MRAHDIVGPLRGFTALLAEGSKVQVALNQKAEHLGSVLIHEGLDVVVFEVHRLGGAKTVLQRIEG
jgi:hypothetical protein